jgi:hypothetical protein
MPRRALALALLAAAACTAPQPCPTPLEECEGQCVDVRSDRRYCGGCGVRCPAGEVCSGGACTADVLAPCPLRTGGAFVTLGHCGTTVKLWLRADAFIDEAIAWLGVPDPAFVPSLAVLARSDCDAQWSWHVDPAAAGTTDAAAIDPDSGCTRCPGEIQPADPRGAPTARAWCPLDAQVLAVDDRRGP